MNWIKLLFRRLNYLRHRRQMDADLAEEMRLHLELKTETEIDSGATAKDAEAAAKRQFGNAVRLREKSRDAWGWGWLDSVGQDLRYGWRNLVAARGFTLTAIVSLALGIGANTAVFSIVNAIMLRALPVQDPQNLVKVHLGQNGSVTNPLWEEIRDRQNTFSATLAYSTTSFDLAEQGEKRPAAGLFVSGQFFDTLGIDPWLGRFIAPEDDRPSAGSAAVAVISYAFWKSEFGSDPKVIGKIIHLDRLPFEVIGVAPPTFAGLDVDSQFAVAIPIAAQPIFHPDQNILRERSAWWLRVVARLQPGIPIESAEARLASVTPAILEGALPPWGPEGEREFLKNKLTLAPAATGFTDIGKEGRTALFACMGVVALVLLIACANIANLLLARAAARRQEISIRLAIGAGRKRLVRQLLTESVLLALLGVPGGLLLAHWGSNTLVRMFSTDRRQLSLDLSLDSHVLLFTIGITAFTGFLFGLAPAFRATRMSPNEVLKQTSGAGAGGRSRIGKGLVAAQVALSLSLLVAAGLFLGTLRNLMNVSLGFNQKNVLSVALDTAGRVPREQRLAVFEDALEKVRQTPGITSAGIIAIQPMSGAGWNGNLYPPGYASEKNKRDRDHETWFNRTSPGFFQTMHTPLLMGRDFARTDVKGSPEVIILGEKTARDLFGTESPLGKYIDADSGPGGMKRFQVIGVVADTKYREVKEGSRRTAFMPIAQDDSWPRMTMMVRSESQLGSLIPGLREVIVRAHPELALQFAVLDLQIRETLRTQRVVAILSTFFSCIAVMLALIGLYGVTSYAVTQRRGEIGIRMALGAQRSSVIWLILREVALVLVVGSVLGIAISLGTGKLLTALMYGMEPANLFVLLSAAGILVISGGLAGLFPAVRASRLDPAMALRYE